jgi:N utilization substance protein A
MNKDFIKALAEIEKEKGIPKEVLLQAIEDALVSSYKKKFNTSTNVRVDIDRKTGAIKVVAVKMVVDDIIDERLEILIEEARKMKPDVQLDEMLDIEVTPKDFGRISAQTAKQVVMQRIKEAERGIIYNNFLGMEDQLVTGKVEGEDARNLYVRINNAEAILPISDILPTDKIKKGDTIQAYINKVESTTRGTLIQLSRVHPGHLKRLFETKIPEVERGDVVIKSIAREAGVRSKVAVFAANPEVDAVAACVGVKGAIIQSISSSLGGEKIDIMPWSSDMEEFIGNSLAPAHVLEVKAFDDEEDPMARVIVRDHQLTLAIGIKGINARLSAKLTGWKIDIFSEAQALKEFNRPRTPEPEYE